MSLLLFVAMTGIMISSSAYLYVNQLFLAAAREGARAAATDTRLAGAAAATATSEIKTRVKNFVSQTSGIQLQDNNITLTGPTGSTGNRTVSLNINYQFTSPIRIGTYINRLNGGSTSASDTFTINSTATMRYEE